MTLLVTLLESGLPDDFEADPSIVASIERLSLEHRVAPLLLARLDEAGLHDAPFEQLRQSLRGTGRTLAAYHLARQAALQEVSRAFREASIEAVLVKGTALAFTAYDDPAQRLGIDTDLFIPMDRIEATARCLERLGYRVPAMRYKSRQFTCIKELGAGATIALDVHWRISNAPAFAASLDHAEVCAAAEPVAALGGLKAMSPVHSLLLAHMHRAVNDGHGPDRLIDLVDIRLLVEALDPGDTERFVTLANKRQVAGACRSGLEAAAARFGQDWSSILSALAQGPLEKGGFRNSHLGLFWSDLQALPEAGQRLRLARELLFPDGPYLRKKYHKPDSAWMPWLYLRHLAGGVARRLTLH